MSTSTQTEPQLHEWEITYRSNGNDEHKRRVLSQAPMGGKSDGWLQFLDQTNAIVFSIRTAFVISVERVASPLDSERVYGERDAPGKRPTAA